MRAGAAGIVIGAMLLAGPVLAQHLDGGPFSGAKLHPKSRFAAPAQDAAATAPSPAESARPLPAPPQTSQPGKRSGSHHSGSHHGGGGLTLDKLSPGNRRIALALAKESLERRGIDHPTRQQLRQALHGGAGKPGILDLRARGMGWGEIAHAMGFKLGDAMRHDGRHGHGHKHKHHARHDDHKHKHHARHEHKRHDWKHDRRHQGHAVRVHRAEKPEKHHRPERPERFERPRHRD